MTADQESNIDWSTTTWKGSRLQQHREFLALPFRRKLQVVEGMSDLAEKMLNWRKARGLPYIDPVTGELVKASQPKAT